ncbi:hypothetical protein M422DRAFT_251593 [Sphaerobolus stellatus SS14]|uniref:Uncharacterized protein n=1 Tax=Sphaerobolus stellatus (strain SS14) TaxID=990650 RepID=A0A0C9W0L7_SPHS4|nr:hypothetical protein M422DRAFT_251593 [Sphaerobolus stellatus SS14]
MSLPPPQIDIISPQEEGVWATFNKAMHAAFGNKKNSPKWTLSELHTACDNVSVPLVKLWMDVLMTAAKDASAHVAEKEATSTSVAQPKHNICPNHQQELCESATYANMKVKQVPTRKVKPSHIYINEHGSIMPQEDVAMDTVPNMIIESVSEAETDPEYVVSSIEPSASDTDGEMEIEADESVSNTECKAVQTAAVFINDGLPKKKQKHKNKDKTSKNKSNDQGSSSAPTPPKKKAHTQTDTGEVGEESGAQDNAEPPMKRDLLFIISMRSFPITVMDSYVHRKIKGSQTSLMSHLQTYFPAMFCLYSELKVHPDRPPTVQELQIAANIIPLDSKTATDYIQALEVKTGPLINTL